MKRSICAWAVLSVAAVVIVGTQGQETKKAALPAKSKVATPAAGITWAKSFDGAMRMMGADATPVILYFTYDT